MGDDATKESVAPLKRPPVGILAGGLGTRLSEETEEKPKPMVEIGGFPILWHLMKNFSAGGFENFVIALGYKGAVIKDFFLQYRQRGSDLSIDLGSGETKIEKAPQENWRVQLIDTGMASQTGGRVKQILQKTRERTVVTYGDGLSTIDFDALIDFHESHGKLATVSAVRPPARFGELRLSDGQVTTFAEKPQVGEGWINGGFFVLEPEVADYIPDLLTPFEASPLERLTSEGQLMAYQHPGFWQCMDTLRDVKMLQSLWDSGAAPWWPSD